MIHSRRSNRTYAMAKGLTMAYSPQSADKRNNAGGYLRARKICSTCGRPTNTMGDMHWNCLRDKRGELVSHYTEGEL